MHTSLTDCFEETAKKKAADIAIEHNDESITFEELHILSHKLAGCVRNTVCSRGPVAVYMPKCINAVVADLGVLFSGCFFMNLNVADPSERISSIIGHIKPAAIITFGKYAQNGCFDNISVPVINMDDIKEWEKLVPPDQYRNSAIDTDPMCIINTSGSTGIPKGVVLNHRSFFDFFRWANEEYCFDGSEVIGSLSPIVFDIFDFELCMLMCKGTKIVLLDSMLAAFPVRLLEAVRDKKVSFIFWVPSIMVNIANMDLLSLVHLPDLRTVWFAGEVFPTNQFCYWYDKLPDANFSNLYGPIEITLDCTFFRVKERPKENEPLPIGIPCKNTDVMILDENDRPCDAGHEGELCVRGTSLAMGYYNDAEKTNRAFVQNPLNKSYPELIYRTGDIVVLGDDGQIHYRGRRDSLIKHLGYRIELGEIEHIIINELKLVDYCCAVYNHSEKKIVLLYESKENVPEKTFVVQLKQIVPSYMVPGKYKRLDMLPRNANGKIDRLRLQREEDTGSN